jgi:hypothetical protein
MYLKKLIQKLIKEEEGSSLIEFALVLPMLIVLTIGGIYFSISFGQKAILNGVNFMAVRAGSVRENPGMMAKKEKELYEAQAEGRQKWVGKAEIIPQIGAFKANNGMADFRLIMTKDGMRIAILINSLSILSGKKPDYSIQKLASTMTLPIEYVKHKTASGSSDQSKTYSVVDYETKIGLEKYVDNALSALSPEAQAKIKEKIFKKFVDSKYNSNSQIHGIDADKGKMVLGAVSDNNMNNIKATYDDWGVRFDYHAGSNPGSPASENPEPRLLDIDSLSFLEESAKHAKAIKNSALAIKALSQAFEVYLYPFDMALAPIKGAAKVIEPVAGKAGRAAELNNKIIFRKNTFGIN